MLESPISVGVLGGNIETIKRMKPVNVENVVGKPPIKEKIVAEVTDKPTYIPEHIFKSSRQSKKL